MRYHNITKDDMLNGEGLRTVLWVAGCSHHCPQCHNPVTWDINGGLVFDEQAKEELFEELKKDYVSGVTFSGGDPFHLENREEIGALAKEIREKFPDKTIWLYTGYEWKNLPSVILSNIDVIVDRKFKIEEKDKSSLERQCQQRVIDVKHPFAQERSVFTRSNERRKSSIERQE
ncbi:MAG: anaerobic ribonucleoside-triphosphate reductase activating protein [Clostridium sp.]